MKIIASKDIESYHFNTQLLLKELFKRSIQISVLEDTNVFFLEYKEHTEIIHGTELSNMPACLQYVLDDKYLTKQVLKELDLGVPEGKAFHVDNYGDALKYAGCLGYPVVLKPSSGSQGESVFMNIYNPQDFLYAFNSIMNNTIQGKKNFIFILIEKQVIGKEYRIFATKDNFIAVVEREPANVIGNGNMTVKELIEETNYKRTHPRSSAIGEIWLDDISEKHMKENKISFSYIPKNGEKIYIRPNSNVSTGGNCRDVTDFIHPSIVSIVSTIFKGFPKLPYIGIDLITEDISHPLFKENYGICELNSIPGLSLHSHEETGRPRNAASALVDTLFPETKKRIL